MHPLVFFFSLHLDSRYFYCDCDYGNFTVIIITIVLLFHQANPGQEKKLHEALQRVYLMATDNKAPAAAVDSKESERGAEYYDYVFVEVSYE